MLIRVRMDESERQAENRHSLNLAKSKITHMNWAARRYAATLKRGEGLAKDRMVTLANLKGVMRSYSVHPLLLEAAAKKCAEFAGVKI